MVGTSDRGAIHALPGSRPLQPDDFTFHGFGQLRRDEVRKIIRLGIREGEPTASSVDGAIFVPTGYAAAPDQPKFAGGVVGPTGLPIDAALTHRKGGKRVGGLTSTVGIEPDRELDEEVVYLGILFNHYGRVLLESLARVWYLNQVAPSTRVVFSNGNAAQAAYAPWVPGLLETFGIPRERILDLDVPTRLRRAIVPEALFEQLYSAHAEMVRPFRETAARLAGDVSPSDQPLYLSRRMLSSRQRPIIGEEELEEVLREQGFAIAYPERMPFPEQVRLINGHKEIFSSLGSAAHSVLFALHRPRLHLLTGRENIPANYFLCSSIAETPTTFVNCLGSGGRSSPYEQRLQRREGTLGGGEKKAEEPEAGPQAMPQILDLDLVTGYLDERGLLKRRPASLASPNARSLQDRFDESWFFSRVRKGGNKADALPAEIESEARELAARSWPVSLMLARYYTRLRDGAAADAMARQFVALATAETDPDRLAHYRGDVEGIAGRLGRVCKPDTAAAVADVLRQRFALDLPGERGQVS
jgi:hypothetical protein